MFSLVYTSFVGQVQLVTPCKNGVALRFIELNTNLEILTWCYNILHFFILLNRVKKNQANDKNANVAITELELLYSRKTNVFGGILESACLSVRVSVRPLVRVCLSVYKILLSVKAVAGVSSHSKFSDSCSFWWQNISLSDSVDPRSDCTERDLDLHCTQEVGGSRLAY